MFIHDKDLKESMLIKNPLPSNFQEVKRMGEYIVQLLKKKKIRKKALLNQDSIYEKSQKKNLDV